MNKISSSKIFANSQSVDEGSMGGEKINVAKLSEGQLLHFAQ